MQQNHLLYFHRYVVKKNTDDTYSPKPSSRNTNDHLEGIYDEGFHICNSYYGQTRENSEECLFCTELLDRKMHHEDSKKF